MKKGYAYLIMVLVAVIALMITGCAQDAVTQTSIESYVSSADNGFILNYVITKYSDGSARVNCSYFSGKLVKAYSHFPDVETGERYHYMCVIVFQPDNTQSDFWQINNNNGVLTAFDMAGTTVNLYK
jgi:hypothetical protein